MKKKVSGFLLLFFFSFLFAQQKYEKIIGGVLKGNNYLLSIKCDCASYDDNIVYVKPGTIISIEYKSAKVSWGPGNLYQQPIGPVSAGDAYTTFSINSKSYKDGNYTISIDEKKENLFQLYK